MFWESCNFGLTYMMQYNALRDVDIVIIRSEAHAIFTWRRGKYAARLIKMIFLTVLIPI